MITPRISKSKAASLCANTLSISLRRENLRRLKRIRRVLTLAFENSALGFEQLLFNVPAIRQCLSKWFSLPLPPAKFPLNKITFLERSRGFILISFLPWRKLMKCMRFIFISRKILQHSREKATFFSSIFFLFIMKSFYHRKIKNIYEPCFQ